MFAFIVSDFTLKVIYFSGVVLTPVLVGMFWPKKLYCEEYIPLTMLSIIWPIALCVVALVAVSLLATLVFGFVFSVPLELGRIVRMAYLKRREAKKELEHAKKVQNAKP